MKKGVLCIALCVLAIGAVGSVRDTVQLLFFYEAGCPHCARVEQFLEQRIAANYPVKITDREVHTPAHAKLLGRLSEAYGVSVYTPSVFIGDTVIHGDERTALATIEKVVRQVLQQEVSSPLTRLDEVKGFHGRVQLTALLGAALADAVNPCAFAVLVLLLGTVLVGNKRRGRLIKTGLAFTAATFLAYLLMGLGLFYAIQLAGIQQMVFVGVAVIAVMVGLANLKDYLLPGKWFRMEVPASWQPRVKSLTKGVTSAPGAFGTGLLVSVFLLPCTSGPYVVVIGMLGESATRLQAVGLLLLYNLIFVLPFVAITLLVAYGVSTTARIEQFRRARAGTMHLLTGILMTGIGLTLIGMVIWGGI